MMKMCIRDSLSTPEFSFTGSFDLDITVAKAPAGNLQYYVNICSDFEEQNGATVINYDSCLLRAFLTGEDQQFTLNLSESRTQLLAQIWPMENNAVPIDRNWVKQAGLTTWKIEI